MGEDKSLLSSESEGNGELHVLSRTWFRSILREGIATEDWPHWAEHSEVPASHVEAQISTYIIPLAEVSWTTAVRLSAPNVVGWDSWVIDRYMF